MAKKILIDLEKYRLADGKRSDISPPDAVCRNPDDHGGMKSIREVAVFRYSCRRCTDAPCIAVCPADALEKDGQGIITRSNNLCVSCKSCVVACPFGTLMTDFFDYHPDRENLYDLTDPNELELFIRHSPRGAVTLVELEEDTDQDIYRLNDHILIRERMWNKDNP